MLLEGDYHFDHRFGCMTSTEYNIHATSGFPVQECRPGSLQGISGYIVYDM